MTIDRRIPWRIRRAIKLNVTLNARRKALKQHGLTELYRGCDKGLRKRLKQHGGKVEGHIVTAPGVTKWKSAYHPAPCDTPVFIGVTRRELVGSDGRTLYLSKHGCGDWRPVAPDTNLNRIYPMAWAGCWELGIFTLEQTALNYTKELQTAHKRRQVIGAAMDCQTCGACCHNINGTAGVFIELLPEEAAVLNVLHPGTVLKDRRGYRLAHPKRLSKSHACAFAESGPGRQCSCSIHLNKPRTCATFVPGTDMCLQMRRLYGEAYPSRDPRSRVEIDEAHTVEGLDELA